MMCDWAMTVQILMKPAKAVGRKWENGDDAMR